MQTQYIKSLNDKLDTEMNKLLPEPEGIYKDIHRNPELSMQESPGIAADYLTRFHDKVTTGIGITGVAGLMKNGDGPTVMIRADMDALPVAETTNLPYASTKKTEDRDGMKVGVSHVCGHDLHVTFVGGTDPETYLNCREWYEWHSSGFASDTQNRLAGHDNGCRVMAGKP